MQSGALLNKTGGAGTLRRTTKGKTKMKKDYFYSAIDSKFYKSLNPFSSAEIPLVIRARTICKKQTEKRRLKMRLEFLRLSEADILELCHSRNKREQFRKLHFLIDMKRRGFVLMSDAEQLKRIGQI